MKKNSIQIYIFKSVVLTLLLISSIILVVNVIVIKNAKTEYLTHELEDAIKDNNENIKIQGVEYKIVSFEILGTKNDFTINYTVNTKHLPCDKKIATEYFDTTEDEGVIRENKKDHYYAIDSDDSKLLVYVVSVDVANINAEIIIMFLLIIVAVFIASFRIAKYISDPIKKLSSFSEEIAEKNWDSELGSIKNYELSKLGDALINMKRQLEKADNEERQFLQATSHDLKTPIMVIKGYAQAVIDKMPVNGELSAEEVILREAERLERKVKQLIHLNTIGYSLSKEEHFDAVRVDRILKMLAEKMRVVNLDLNINTVLVELECIGDSDALLIAFENIIENQLRYAHSRIDIVMKENSIYISNDGPHFETLPNEMFEIYKKGTSGQFGLGLAITKKVIDSHNGSINAYNTDNGVCFEIQFKY